MMLQTGLRRRAEQQAAICRVFANPTRVLILWTLIGGEKSVGDIAAAVDASLQSTSQHLHIMKQKNLLLSRREGQMIYYRINGAAATQCRLLLDTAPFTAASSAGLS